ncbi:MAG: hypothetical protein N3A71_03195 [Candidatus Dojkabacteria bacterium]|nr:hypothetical protein [Candidatus Dojkabacteria bacterium]
MAACEGAGQLSRRGFLKTCLVLLLALSACGWRQPDSLQGRTYNNLIQTAEDSALKELLNQYRGYITIDPNTGAKTLNVQGICTATGGVPHDFLISIEHPYEPEYSNLQNLFETIKEKLRGSLPFLWAQTTETCS